MKWVEMVRLATENPQALKDYQDELEMKMIVANGLTPAGDVGYNPRRNPSIQRSYEFFCRQADMVNNALRRYSPHKA